MTTSDAAFGPVTYTMPYRRLRRLSRSGARRSYSRTWYLNWGWIGLFFAGLLTAWIFPANFRALLRSLSHWVGLPYNAVGVLFLVLVLTVFFAVLILIHRHFRAEQVSRTDYDSSITLRSTAGGLHFAGPQMEYIVKWSGIHEVLCEPDGIVVVVGGLFFLVPDRAFATADDRHAFLDHMAANLRPEARERSESELQRARRE